MGFKIGDWVSTPNRGVFQISHEIELSAWEITLGGRAELWQPKEGEWVCVDRYDGNLFTVCKFNSHFLDYKDCEPFIGELPSFLKG